MVAECWVDVVSLDLVCVGEWLSAQVTVRRCVSYLFGSGLVGATVQFTFLCVALRSGSLRGLAWPAVRNTSYKNTTAETWFVEHG